MSEESLEIQPRPEQPSKAPVLAGDRGLQFSDMESMWRVIAWWCIGWDLNNRL